jgi:SAM-dependent methyltransferase
MEDKKTRIYFDSITPHYDPNKIISILNFIKSHANKDSSLVDLGCGDGAILQLIKQQTEIVNLYGLDISETYINKVCQTIGCKTILGSILEEGFVSNNLNRFDFAILVSVLHHLIGKNRVDSQEFALKALENSIKIIKPGGYLIIFEPAHEPKIIMDIIFYIKKFFSVFYEGRIEVFQKWFNLGNPIVSYYTPYQLNKMVASLSEAQLIEKNIEAYKTLGIIIKMTALSYTLQKHFSFIFRYE